MHGCKVWSPFDNWVILRVQHTQLISLSSFLPTFKHCMVEVQVCPCIWDGLQLGLFHHTVSVRVQYHRVPVHQCMQDDHSYKQRKYRKIQTTRQLSCPAKIEIKDPWLQAWLQDYHCFVNTRFYSFHFIIVERPGAWIWSTQKRLQKKTSSQKIVSNFMCLTELANSTL